MNSTLAMKPCPACGKHFEKTPRHLDDKGDADSKSKATDSAVTDTKVNLPPRKKKTGRFTKSGQAAVTVDSSIKKQNTDGNGPTLLLTDIRHDLCDLCNLNIVEKSRKEKKNVNKDDESAADTADLDENIQNIDSGTVNIKKKRKNPLGGSSTNTNKYHGEEGSLPAISKVELESMKVKKARTNQEIIACFPALNELRHNIPNSMEFLAKVREQQLEGYNLLYIEEGQDVVSILGYRTANFFSSGKTLCINDFSTLRTKRDQGCGSTLLDWIIQEAKDKKCDTIAIDSGYIIRNNTHRLYTSKGFSLDSHHFELKIQ